MSGKLKPLDVQREEKPGKYADGGGLYLIVASATSKNWSYRYWSGGKERWHSRHRYSDRASGRWLFRSPNDLWANFFIDTCKLLTRLCIKPRPLDAVTILESLRGNIIQN